MTRKLKFSERIGMEEPRTILQLDTMSDELKNDLWNSVLQSVLGAKGGARTARVAKLIWTEFLHLAADTCPSHSTGCMTALRNIYFYSDWTWYHVYNFIEFVADNYTDLTGLDLELAECFRLVVNDVLEDNLSGYRFIGETLAPISSEVEIASIEESLRLAQENALFGTTSHFQKALNLLGKRPSPDFPNSIKESISAVESVVKQLAGVRGGGMDTALTKLDEKVHLHPAFKQGLIKLYGYTSDADGIRHALLDEPSLGFDEAKYMLVACSAFVNFLIAKASASGLLHVT